MARFDLIHHMHQHIVGYKCAKLLIHVDWNLDETQTDAFILLAELLQL